MATIQDINRICRTCLAEKSDLQSLFSNGNIYGDQITLGMLLMSCTSVQVVKGDGLPANVCQTCLQELDRVVSFRKLCETSDETLRLWLKTVAEQQNGDISEGNYLNDDFTEHEEKVMEEDQFSVGYITSEEDISENTDGYVFAKDNMKNYYCDDSYQEIKKNNCKKQYNCVFCGKIFKIEICLKRHLLSHNAKNNETPNTRQKKTTPKKKRKLPRTCNICNKSFRFHSNLERHKVIHTGEKPYLCNVCGKSFSQLSYLKIHSFIHTGEKPYKCQMCERSFGAPGTLMTHIRTHTGERPHICKICGKDFPQSGYLSAHIRTHTGEKPVECKVCHRRFTQSGRLTIHMRIHSGEKPYTCKECGRSFAVKGTLKKHIRTHTGERPYICSVCGQSFAQSGTLATHMKVHKPKVVV